MAKPPTLGNTNTALCSGSDGVDIISCWPDLGHTFLWYSPQGVSCGHVLHLTGILSEASYGFNFCTSFYSPLYPCKAVLIYCKWEKSVSACLLGQQKRLQPVSPKLSVSMLEDMASVLCRGAGIPAAQITFLWFVVSPEGSCRWNQSTLHY